MNEGPQIKGVQIGEIPQESILHNQLGILKAEAEPLHVPELFSIEADSIVDAHRQLGEQSKWDVLTFARNRFKEQIGALIEYELHGERVSKHPILFSRECREHALTASSALSEPHRKAVEKYFESLQVWVEAADLGNLAEEYSNSLGLNGNERLEAVDVATWLQNENVGCMTAIIDTENGALMTHFEEYGSNNKSRILDLKIGDRNILGYHYPNLLPGSGFSVSWSEGSTKPPSIHSVDSKFTVPPSRPAMLANMAVWAVAFADEIDPSLTSMSLEEIVHGFGEYVDGYSIQRLRYSVSSSEVESEAVTFALDKVVAHPIGNIYIQGNIFDKELHEQQLERFDNDVAESDDPKLKYEARYKRWGRFFDKVKSSLVAEPLYALKRFMAFRVGGDFANANPDVWASTVVKYDTGTFEMEILPGWLRKDEVDKPVKRISLTRDADGAWNKVS